MMSADRQAVRDLLWMTAAAVAMPILLGVALESAEPLRFVSIPLHSVMEATGGIIALVISVIFYLKYLRMLVLTHFNWSTGALLAMGIIDIFHASVMPGNLFVWLHSTAVFFGGLFFVSVWIPERRVRSGTYRAVPLLFIGFSLLFGGASILFEPQLPAMLDADGSFSHAANLLNIGGGVGFFIAAVRFGLAYLLTREREELLFAGHTMLFGTAGVLFVSSVIWDMQWWLWHLLRLLAYVIAFYMLYIEYRRDIQLVEQTNAELETANRKLGEYLGIVDRNVITSSTDVQGTIVDVSQAFCDISGYRREELIGHSHNIVRHPDMPHTLYEEMWATVRRGEIWYGEIKNRRKDGTAYWVDAVLAPQFDEVGRITGYTAIRQDITDRKRAEALAVTDELSGLFNRRHFNRTLEAECHRAMRDGRRMAFAIMDIDHFKPYNDTYGHLMGDEVIRSVGEVLLRYTRRSGDFAFRLGGEEFGILLSFTDTAAVFTYVDDIRNAVQELGIEHSGNEALGVVTLSGGIALFGGEGADRCEGVYSDADTELYRAKEEGRNRIFMA